MAFDASQLDVGARYSRPELARLWGYRSHEAISRGVVTPSRRRDIILFVTRQKQRSLTQYDDFLNGDLLHWQGEAKHGSDERIASAHRKGDAIHLFYREIHHTPFTYYGEIRLTSFHAKKDVPSEFVFQVDHDLGPDDDLKQKAAEYEDLPPTEREAVVKARVGQGRFREGLFMLWNGCAVTGVRHPELLRASHIKPWRWSSNAERLDPHNGLLLLPHYDLLFDRGYITFDGHGSLVRSPAIMKIPSEQLGIDSRARLRQQMDANHVQFLEYHREKVFLASVA